MIYLTKVQPASNAYRFYALDVQPDLFGGWSLVREFGRIGHAGGRLILKPFETEVAARKAMNQALNDRLRRGYSPLIQEPLATKSISVVASNK